MKFNKFYKSDLFIFILFLLIFYSIFRYSDSFTHGYDITEDHAFITTEQSLESKSFLDVYEKMINTELKAYKRFRPMWVLYLLSTVEIFGVNFLLINLYLALICIVTSFLLFKFCFNIGFSRLQSFLFALLTLIGPATVMYIRPPDAEIMGMMILSLSLYFLSKSIYSIRNQNYYKICFVISIILNMLSKESFLINTPAILFLYIWLYSYKNDIGIFQSIKKNYIILVLPSIIAVVVLALIMNTIGINQDRSYSGVDINLFSTNTILDYISLIFKTNIFLIILFGIFIYFDIHLKNENFKSVYKKKYIRNSLLAIFFLLLITIPQFIIYYKTGFTGRYYLPFYVGFSFILVYFLKAIFDNKSISSFVKYLFLSTIFLYLIIELKVETIPSIVNFSNRCKETTNSLNMIMNDPDEDLLLVFDPIQNFWDIYSLDLYLNHFNKRKDYKYNIVMVDNLSKMYSNKDFQNKISDKSKIFLEQNQYRIIDSEKKHPEINNVLVLENLDSKFINQNKNWFIENNYNKNQFGRYTFYSKK